MPEIKWRNKTKHVARSPRQGPSDKAKPTGEALKKRILLTLTGVLPPMPRIVLRAQKIMSDPGSSLKDLAAVIATDQAISVRALKLANSAYYGLAGKVTSIGHASVLLGIKSLGEIIMMAGTANLLGKTLRGYRMESEEMWRHSLAVAIGSRLIAGRKEPETANDAFMAGLIHDSGKIMLDQHIFERREDFEEFMKDGTQTFFMAEKALLEFDHSEIGAEVCRSWGIPEILTTAVRYHHNPFHSKGNMLAHIVHMADYLALTSGIGVVVEDIQYQVDDNTREILGLEEEDMGGIMDQVVQSVEKLVERMQEL